MVKSRLYVSVTDHRVYSYPDDSPWEFEIAINNDHVRIFRRLFEQIGGLEYRNFLRSHLPYDPYHADRDNQEIDMRTKKIYALIHEYSDEETKQFIEKLPYFR